MKLKYLGIGLLGLFATTVNATTYNYGFEGVSGPSQFAGANSVTVTEEYATFKSGVVLSNPSDFPIFDSAFKSPTNTNVYGTSNFGNQLSNIINIDISKNYVADLISFNLFNGMTVREKYSINAYDINHAILSTQTSGNLDGNFTPDKSNVVGGASYKTITFDNSIGNIYYIDVISDQTSHSSTTNGWDFLIDDVHFDGVAIAESVPEPETYAMLLAGFGIMGFVGRRRKAI